MFPRPQMRVSSLDEPLSGAYDALATSAMTAGGALFWPNDRGEKMRAAFLIGFAAMVLTACSSSNEPVQQATAAHVAPGIKAAMSSSGQANCAMIGGSLSVARQLDGSSSGMCALPNGKRCTEQSLASGTCGSY